ncbi:MAG: ABC transporter permease [Actinobacteria bacterium]|nr:ABC transporter permease [Actinomycetota bacterium]
MNLRFLLGEVGTGLRRTFTLTLAILVTSTIALSMLALSLLVRNQVVLTEQSLYERVEITVFLCAPISPVNLCREGSATTSQINQIEKKLESLRPLVTEIKFENQAEAFERFQSQFAGTAVAAEATVDQMPESFRVSMSNPEQYEKVVKAVSKLPGVEYVQDQQAVLDSLFVSLNYLQIGAISIAALMLLVVMVLTINTMRIAAFSRRDEIGIMRLVGASKSAIRLPFVMEAMIAAFIGAMLAAGLIAAFQYWVVDGLLVRTVGFLDFVVWRDVFISIGISAGIGLLLTMLVATVSIRRYLKV